MVPFLRMRPPFYYVWLLIVMVLVYGEIFGELTVHCGSRVVGWIINRRRR